MIHDHFKVNTPEGLTIYVTFALMGVPDHGARCCICGKKALSTIMPMEILEIVDGDYRNIRKDVLPDSIRWASVEFWLQRELEQLVGNGATCRSTACYTELARRRAKLFP